MKSLPRNARIKGKATPPSRFIFGDALDGQGLETAKYLIHTSQPAFICRLMDNDETDFPGRDQHHFTSTIIFDEEANLTVYLSNMALCMFDFNFSDASAIPTVKQLQEVCDAAAQEYARLQQAYDQQNDEEALTGRDLKIASNLPLSTKARQLAIQKLLVMARKALTSTASYKALGNAVRMAMFSGDVSILTEAQLALLTEPEARDLLLESARHAIAFPDVTRKTGQVTQFELWALPFAFSRAQAGVWWHFPLLEQLESILKNTLAIPQQATLWVSSSVFTLEMLNEQGCQNLVQLAPTLEEGFDFAPLDPLGSRSTYEVLRKNDDPQLVMAWIPFLVEREALTLEQVQRFGRRALDEAMPLIQEAVTTEMEYGEAELFSPLPWWQAVQVGVNAWNRKRLGLSVALLAATVGDLHKLEAVAEYQPEIQGYSITLHEKGKTDGMQVQASWMVPPDIAPNRREAWASLASCLEEAGIALSESALRLH